MKKSAIKDIFNGTRGDMETMKMPQKRNENLDIVCDYIDELKEKLSPELFALHENVINGLESNFIEEVNFYFVEGFKLGLLIGVECMED